MARLNFDLPIIGLIDGAQRIEAICQLMDEAKAKFPMTYQVNVAIPDPDKYTARWDFSKVVAAAFFLNQVTKTDVPVSFWDRIKGFESFIGAITNEYPDLWLYGFQTKIAKTVFLLNMQKMGSNFFECLVKKKRTAAAALRGYSGEYKSESWQIISIKNVKQHLQTLHFEHQVVFYCDEFEFFEAVLSNHIVNFCFSHIGQTGALSRGYSLLLCPEICNLDNLRRIEIDLHHPIFQKFAFQILHECKTELELVCLMLRLLLMSTVADSEHRGSFTLSWYTEQKRMVELGLRQLKIIQDIQNKYQNFADRADEEVFNSSRIPNKSTTTSKKRKAATGNFIFVKFYYIILKIFLLQKKKIWTMLLMKHLQRKCMNFGYVGLLYLATNFYLTITT